MTTVLAVDIYSQEAVILALQSEPGEKVVVLRSDRFTLPTPAPAEHTPDSGGSEIPSAEANGTRQYEPVGNLLTAPLSGEENGSPLGVFQDIEFDAALAVTDSSQVLYSQLQFPFRDQKKIEQVAPIQVQDSLPFEIDDFVLDSVVLGENKDGEFQILSTLTPRLGVATTLSALQSVGIDPKILTTRASALGNLALFCHPEVSGLNAYVLVADSHISVAVILDGVVVSLRELLRVGSEIESAVRSIACTLLFLEQQHEQETVAVHVVAGASELAYLRRMLFRPVKPLDLSDIVEVAPGVESSLASIASAIGASACEFVPKKRGDVRKFVDFRQGSFAYRRAWIALWTALKQEAFYIVIAAVLGIAWFGGRLYLSAYSLSQVNHRISDSIAMALPGESVPPQGEAAYLQSKLDGLEEELRGMGSLSSLSPLESLKELVAAAGPSLSVMVDQISIAHSKMNIRGSVADNLSIGNLSSALKARKDRFCDVKVDPKGKTAENRVAFSAEIAFCE